MVLRLTSDAVSLNVMRFFAEAPNNYSPDFAWLVYNMLDPKSSMLKNVLFSGSYQSYNERVIGLSKHCLS